MNRFLILGICFLCLALAAFADPELSVPPPSAPYVAAPRPGTSWEIFIEVRAARKDAPAAEVSFSRRPAIIRVEKNGIVSRVDVTWGDGSTLVGYVVKDCYIFKSPKTGRLNILSAQDGNLMEPIYVGGYQATAWIGKSDYRGVEKYGGDDCYRYHRDYSARMEGGEMTISPELNAWIRIQDGLPLCVQVGELLYRYRHGKAGSTHAEIPADIQQKLAQVQKEQETLDRLKTRNIP